MKHFFISLLLLTGASFCKTAAQTPAWAVETPEQKQERMAWWTHDRFGMFIHWGIYAVPGRHEWIKKRENIPDEKYLPYMDYFDPDLYDPADWAAKAKRAGMKYAVITSKHHDGFCMWDSKLTEYKVTNTPYGKDILKEFVDAFRAEGIRVGFYYSMIDWNHPDFTMDRNYPLYSPDKVEEHDRGRDMDRYREYMKGQMRELLTNYGQIDELFMDFSYPGPTGKGHLDWDSEGLVKIARELQPQIIINNRLDMGHTDWGWDYITPEQFMPAEWPTVNGNRVAWETCQTFSGSWGYYRDEYSWKSVHQLIVMLVETVSKGGNLLLNVGPTARGEFDHRANERLDGIGEWMYRHSRAVYGCTEAPQEYQKPDNCLLTYNPQTHRLYIHVLDWPFKSLHLKNYRGKIKYAQLLNDGSEIRYRTDTSKGSHMTENSGENDVILSIPVQKPDVEVPVIEIILE